MTVAAEKVSVTLLAPPATAVAEARLAVKVRVPSVKVAVVAVVRLAPACPELSTWTERVIACPCVAEVGDNDPA